MRSKKNIQYLLYAAIISILILSYSNEVAATDKRNADTTPLSTQKQALQFLEKQTNLEASKFWPKVNPVSFLQNLKQNVEYPLSVHEGRGTNFCGYAALTYHPLHDDPLGYVSFMLKLFKEAKATYGKEYFEPSKAVQQAAGTLTFKGELDLRPADQLWFLVLADHFKGYLNTFNKQYNIGDENTFWPSVNFAKYNRMVRNLFNYKITSSGTDLIRPTIRDVFTYLSEGLQKGTVTVFLSNPQLYKKNHSGLKLSIPTHFIILTNIQQADGVIAITYWDYAGKTRQLFPEAFLKKIIFGISIASNKTTNAK
jgi:hypothetical protein